MKAADIDRIADWIVRRGLEGTAGNRPAARVLREVQRSRPPDLARALVVIDTLHPVHEGTVFRWRNDDVEEDAAIQYGRTTEGEAAASWQRSPFYHLLQTGGEELRRRIGFGEPTDFPSHPGDEGRWVTPTTSSSSIASPTAPRSARWTASTRAGRRATPTVSATPTSRPCAASCRRWGSPSRAPRWPSVADTLVEVYLGRDAGQRVLNGRIQRGVADRIEAALWFSDLRSFTTITDTAKPTEIIPLLNDYAEAVITRHPRGGRRRAEADRRRHAGDRSAPTIRPRPAGARSRPRQICAARVRDLNEQRRAEEQPVTSVYVGLHVGEVFYGNIGSVDRLDFTVVGPAVNETSRIASMCRSVDRPILISSTFADALPSAGAHQPGVGRPLRAARRRPRQGALHPRSRDPLASQSARSILRGVPQGSPNTQKRLPNKRRGRPDRRAIDLRRLGRTAYDDSHKQAVPNEAAGPGRDTLMANTKRRSVLKLAGGTAAGRGMAGILATGRTPAYAQQKTVHWLKWVDFVPATDQMFRTRADAAGREGARHQDQSRDGERQRPAAAHHRRHPVGRRSRPDHVVQQLHPSLRQQRRRPERDSPRKSASARAASTSTPRPSAATARMLHGHAVGGDRRHDRLSQVVVRRGRRDQVPRHLGELSRGRQEAEGQGPSVRPDARPHLRRRAGLHLSVHVVVGRQGGRGRRQDRRHQLQGDGRVGQVHAGLCGRTAWTRAASPGTTPTTTVPSCRRPSRRR